MDYQAPLSMVFSRQDYWSGLPCPPPGDLPDPATELAALAGRFFTITVTWEAPNHWTAREFSSDYLSQLHCFELGYKNPYALHCFLRLSQVSLNI